MSATPEAQGQAQEKKPAMSRRQLFTAGGGLVASALLAACGGEPEVKAAPPAAPDAPSGGGSGEKKTERKGNGVSGEGEESTSCEKILDIKKNCLNTSVADGCQQLLNDTTGRAEKWCVERNPDADNYCKIFATRGYRYGYSTTLYSCPADQK